VFELRNSEMKLYHGTNEIVAQKALKEGLKPRGNRKGNWKHTVDSRRDAVYLTDIYGPYFAYCASKGKQRPAVLEVDLDKLDQSRLIPDEDFLEQATRGVEGVAGHCPKEIKSMKARTEYYRAIAELNPQLWEKSLAGLGTVSYQGTIPPEAITRVAYIRRDHDMLFEAADAMICLMNHKLCKPKYEAITKWAFGEAITAKDLDLFSAAPIPDSKDFDFFKEMAIKRCEHYTNLIADRVGVEVTA
jgi:hypothetical protein